MKRPQDITPAVLRCVVMPNGEVLCLGRVIGMVGRLETVLIEVDDHLADDLKYAEHRGMVKGGEHE